MALRGRWPSKAVTVNLLYQNAKLVNYMQGGHGTGKTGNLAVNFSRQGNIRNLVNLIFYTAKIVPTQGKF